MLIVHLGPMFSGKTMALLEELKRRRLSGKSVALVKHSIDVRNETVHSRFFNSEMGATHICESRLSDIQDSLLTYDVIGIDELHFFDDVAQFVTLCLGKQIIVVVSALNGDFNRQPFDAVSALVPLATRIEYHTAVCNSCGADAYYSKKIGGSNKQQIEVGGAELYEVNCVYCFSK